MGNQGEARQPYKTDNLEYTATTSNYSARSRKLSVLSSLAVPELDDSPIASGEAALWAESFFREVGIPEISWRMKGVITRGKYKLTYLYTRQESYRLHLFSHQIEQYKTINSWLPSLDATSSHKVELDFQCTPSQILNSWTIRQQQLVFSHQSIYKKSQKKQIKVVLAIMKHLIKLATPSTSWSKT